MWIFFALLTPVFWSFVHVMDSHCVDEVFEKPWMGMIIGSITSTVVLLLAPFVVPHLLSNPLPIHVILTALLAGALIQLSQLFYFKALAYSEAGIVAAYWNMVPALLPIVSFFILRDILDFNEYLGIAILVFGSIMFCLLDTGLNTRWQAFSLMFIAAIFQVGALLLEDIVFQYARFIDGFFLNTVGLIFMGLLPLFIRRTRETFIRNAKKLKAAMHMFFGIEILNLFALATSQKAISLGNPSLVAAVETTVPAYTFLLSILFLKIYPKFGDVETFTHLLKKFLLVALMTLGVFLIAQG